MASYDLSILCSPRTHTLSVHSKMSVKEIIQRIASHFNLIANSFNVQIYDERIKMYVDFDEQYGEELRQRLPRTHKTTLVAQVSLLETNDAEEDFDLLSEFQLRKACIEQYYSFLFLDDLIVASNASVKSPISISAIDGPTPITTDIDMDSWLLDTSKLPEHGQVDVQNDSHSVDHIIFERDVVPYERDQYLDILHEDKTKQSRKNSHIRRVQGVKNPDDERYASVLPEIKVSFLS